MDISIILKWKREEINDIFEPKKTNDKKVHTFFVITKQKSWNMTENDMKMDR